MEGIRSGNLDRAVSEWNGDSVLGAYLWWWSHGAVGSEPADRWDGLLAGRTVELRGPADYVAAECELLARVLRGPESDPSCDISYVNHNRWSRIDKGARLAVVSKGREAEGLEKGRFIWDSRTLFYGGDWNMVPAAMLDLLTGRAQVTITGASFYAVGRDYAEDDKISPWESIKTANPVLNWRVVKNLFDARVVTATGLAADVLAVDEPTYFRMLSAHRKVVS